MRKWSLSSMHEFKKQRDPSVDFVCLSDRLKSSSGYSPLSPVGTPWVSVFSSVKWERLHGVWGQTMKHPEKRTILPFKDVCFKYLFYAHLVWSSLGDGLRYDSEVSEARPLSALAGVLRALYSRPVWCCPRGAVGRGALGRQKRQCALLSLCGDLN